MANMNMNTGGGHPRPQNLSLEEFLGKEEQSELQNVLGMINGGSFMCCHQQIYESTGIWIEELVPVFQKLDATLATRDVRPRVEQ